MLRRQILLTACVLALPLAGRAQPLGKEECEKLKADYTRLGQSDLKADLDKGPDWGKANLSEVRLKEIQSYIELEEQFLFRCPQPRLVPLTPEAKAASAPPQQKKAGGGGAIADDGAADATEDAGPVGGLSTVPPNSTATKPAKTKKPAAGAAKPSAAAKPAATAKAATAAPSGQAAKPAPVGVAATPATAKPAVKVSKPDATKADGTAAAPAGGAASAP